MIGARPAPYAGRAGGRGAQGDGARFCTRFDRMDILGLCLALFAGGLLWLREMVLFLPQNAEDSDP